MQSIDTYVYEAFRLRDDTKIIEKHHPKTFSELRKLILDKYKINPKHLDCRDIDVSEVKESYDYDNDLGLFQNLNDVETINVRGWDIKNFDNLAQMFKNCTKLIYISGLKKWNIANGIIIDMSSMFANCKNLRDVGDISDWDVHDILGMANMFKGCHKLTEKNVGNLFKWKLHSACVTHGMFDDSGIDFPELL